MSKRPWFPFFAADWYAETATLTLAEQGALFSDLVAAHRAGDQRPLLTRWTALRQYETRTWSKKHYAAAYARDGRQCRYCGATCNLSIDHIVPRSRGGSDELENLAVACRVCNSRKGAR